MTAALQAWIEEIKWDERGLVPVISQEVFTNRVLMFAWMNRESLKLTLETGSAVYWSRASFSDGWIGMVAAGISGIRALTTPLSPAGFLAEIGRASCRERVCMLV